MGQIEPNERARDAYKNARTNKKYQFCLCLVPSVANCCAFLVNRGHQILWKLSYRFGYLSICSYGLGECRKRKKFEKIGPEGVPKLHGRSKIKGYKGVTSWAHGHPIFSLKVSFPMFSRVLIPILGSKLGWGELFCHKNTNKCVQITTRKPDLGSCTYTIGTPNIIPESDSAPPET